MALGPGKYDDLTTHVRQETAALAVLICVFDGTQGSGFSLQAPAFAMPRIADALRKMATQIEHDAAGLAREPI